MAISKEQAEKDGMLGGGAPELRDKNQIAWDDLAVGDTITVKEVVETTNADGELLLAIITEEYPENFLWAGSVIRKWYDKYGLDFVGTVIKIGDKVKTKQGRTCRAFDIV